MIQAQIQLHRFMHGSTVNDSMHGATVMIQAGIPLHRFRQGSHFIDSMRGSHFIDSMPGSHFIDSNARIPLHRFKCTDPTSSIQARIPLHRFNRMDPTSSFQRNGLRIQRTDPTHRSNRSNWIGSSREALIPLLRMGCYRHAQCKAVPS